jgi:alkylation response protein AidB-like acyl-CoA dehydrogenase
VIHNWKESLDENSIVIAMFLDFKRAFETIDRERLIRKLDIIGIRNAELNWIRDYLKERKQMTVFGDSTSEEMIVGTDIVCCVY